MKGEALDVSELPESAMDHRSLIWWGNTLLLVIETVMFALLAASYLYIKMNFPQWPPPLTTRIVTIFKPLPELTPPNITFALLLISAVPAFLADRAALARKEMKVKIYFLILVLLGAGIAISRFLDLHALQFSWDDNAYASVVWTIASLHLFHIVVATAENTAMVIWAIAKGIDKKHARDVRVSAAYWYWVVAIWIPLYILVYISPRFQ